MKKSKSLTFACPGCKETFEFDDVGEYEFVPCPICGLDHQEIKNRHATQVKSLQIA